MADNSSGVAPLMSSRAVPHEPQPPDAGQQLQGLLQEQLVGVKPPQGHAIPRLLSPAPIGLGSSGGGSGSSSQRASPAPPQISSSKWTDNYANDTSQPSTPKRVGGISRGLSLQLPGSGGEAPPGVATKLDVRTPLTPKVDPVISYGSPASQIPRRLKGMDMTRVPTHLHHSTIAEKPDPESSPIVGGRGINMPRRSAFDSPMRGSGNNSGFEQSAISSSVGSTNMMDSGSDSSSDDDIAMRDEDEALMTPQVGRHGMGLSGLNANGLNSSPGGEALRHFTAADGRNYRDRLRSKGSRKNSESKRSSSGWKYEWLSSPGFSSPPVHRSIEGGDNYFQREISRRNIQSRRESLSLGTDELTIDDTTPGSDENRNSSDVAAISEQSAEGRKSVIKRAVTARRSQLIPKSKGFARIRAALMEESAPVDAENRRESEVLRQVKERDEVLPERHEDTVAISTSQPTTTASSPFMTATATAGPTDSPDDMSEINLEGGPQPSTRRSSSSFSAHALKHGAGPEFWNRFLDEDRLRTPPPPLFHAGSSAASVFSDDTSMGLEQTSTNTSFTNGPPLWPNTSRHNSNGSNMDTSTTANNNNNNNNTNQQLLQALPSGSSGSNNNNGTGSQQRTVSPYRTRSSTPTTAAAAMNQQQQQQQQQTQQQTSSFKALGKRRRDDELDSEFFKRRAVSPGLSSIAGSPILPPSPAQRDNTWWNSTSRGSGDSHGGGGSAGNGGSGSAPGSSGKRETPTGHVAGERLASTGSESGRQSSSRGMGVERRVGMLGMNEAGESMSNMSIE